MKDTVIFEFCWDTSRQDIEAPKNITCEELMMSLNEGIGLGLDLNDKNSYIFNCVNLEKELVGDKTLENFGLVDGSIIRLE